jgi:HSP20 family protein
MAKDKKSFFERLTGAVSVEEYDELEDSDGSENDRDDSNEVVDEEEGELPVDVYQTPDNIVIKAMIAGVRPEDLDVSITRDTVIIKGSREGARDTSEENYLTEELYWGPFSRTILLPQEIEEEEAEAVEKHGLLIITLPKINKGKQTKLKIKSS